MKAAKPKGYARASADIGAHMDFYELIGLLAEGDEVVGNTALEDIELSHESAGGATFDTVVFRACVFDAVDFSQCTFRDVRFEGCRFMRCSMDKSWLNRCDFTGCSAPGLSLLHARISSVLFADCDLSYANLSETSIDRLTCHGARLVEAALQRARMRHVAFRDCDLTRLDVFGTPLAGIDLSTCTFDAPVLSADFRELRGATVSAQQALELSALLGLVIAEE